MSKKLWTTILLMYLIMFGLNFLMPLCYGDDYVYAFTWSGQSMYIPLLETAQRVSSITDVFRSQWSHYLTGNGRLPAHLLVQFLLWMGKSVFNFLNPIIVVLLVLETYWIADKGNVSFKNLQPGRLWGIFFSLWAFTVNFVGVFLWVSGSCNYLWMTAVLLSFIILYVRKYFSINSIMFHSNLSKYMIFLWGMIAGWTNENTVCWLILLLGVWLFRSRKKIGLETWMWYGLAGLCIGYALLIFAPGNAIRAASYAGINIWSWQHMRSKLITFGVIEFFQIFLWFFILTSFKKIKSLTLQGDSLRQVFLVKVFCAFNLLSNGIMLFAPEFPARSGFASLVFLTIAAASLLRLQSDAGIKLIDEYAGKFLLGVAGLYFIVTLGATYAGIYFSNQYDKNVVELVKQHKAAGNLSVLEIPAPPDCPESLISLSGRHIVQSTLTEDENDWTNVAYARYYGIKGICVKK